MIRLMKLGGIALRPQEPDEREMSKVFPKANQLSFSNIFLEQNENCRQQQKQAYSYTN